MLIVYCKFFILQSAKAYLVPFQISMMDFFRKKFYHGCFIMAYNRFVNPPPYVNMTMAKFHMICKSEESLLGKWVIHPILPKILLHIVFQSDIFYGFTLPGNRGKVKHELRVQIHELRVETHELRVQTHELRVTSSNPRLTSSNPRVTSSNLRVFVNFHDDRKLSYHEIKMNKRHVLLTIYIL